MDSDSSPLSALRNIGIIAHIDAGKTTTTERILYYTGAIHRMGDVDKGNTTTATARRAGARITIVAAAITCRWHDVRSTSSTRPVTSTSRPRSNGRSASLDGAVVIFSAVEGVEAQSETVWRQATKYHVPRLCFINKMDRIGGRVRPRLRRDRGEAREPPHPRQIPIGAGPEGTMGEFKGLIDLIAMKALYYKTEDLGSTITEAELTDDLRPDAELWRERMLETLLDFDEPSPNSTWPTSKGANSPRPISTPPCAAPPDRSGPAGPLRVELQVRRRPAPPRRRRQPTCPAPWTTPGHRRPSQDPGRDCPESRPERPVQRPRFKITNDAHGDLSFVRIYSGILKAGSRA
jgi:elongation factor G